MPVPDQGFVTAPELAKALGFDPKRLRHLIRKHRLVPAHRHCERYRLYPEDVARIKDDHAVRQAMGNARRGVR